ncbi:MAG TPA: PEP-utilizing enzyme, partial [Chloroflexota bacterium]|nr:PEP-utilizing enzyme [Chloroflexota bacterium]
EPLPEALRGQPVIWSTANLKEVVSAVPSPFSWATIRLTVRDLIESTVRRSNHVCPPGLRWARLYRGHPYFNLSLMQWMFYDAFGIAPARMNRLLGGQQPEIRVPPGNPFLGRGGLGRLRGVVRQIADAGRAAAEIERACADASAATRRVLATDVGTKTEAEILDDFYAMGAVYLRFMPEFMRANSQAASWLDNLANTLERLLPGRGRALSTRLLAGTGGIASAEQGYRLAELARTAAADARARAFFLTAQSLPRPNELAAPAEQPAPDASLPLATDWRRKLDGTGSGRAMERFLEEFGHRGVDELEIAQPRWVEDPSYVVETVRQHILGGLETPPEHAAARRAEAEREVAARLRFHPLRPLVGWMVGQARRASALRENSKSVLVLTMMPPRRGALEIGRRLAARGVVRTSEDIFYLTSTDMMALVDGSWDGAGAQRLVDDRRARNRRHYEEGAPDVVLDDRPLAVDHGPASVDAAGETFAGLGVAAGTARGAARIVRHPRDGASLQKGEVLVAPTTDPGWTPLFLRAAGLVMETGGYLSHGAIVAREYGIPAVANLPGIMTALRDSDPLLVDGNTGRVTRQKAPAAAAGGAS